VTCINSYQQLVINKDGQILPELQDKLGYFFKDPMLLKKALIHSSYANERNTSGFLSNERLEFLGDSLLGMIVALLIYEKCPKLSEGKMTKLRAELVCEKSLASLAAKMNIGSYLLLGRGEESGGGRNRPSILSDAFEAVLAAVYLDGGFEPVKRLVFEIFSTFVENPGEVISDYKTMLQELVQEKSGHILKYDLIDAHGPDHNKYFTIAVVLNGKTIGIGTGRSKKSAEQEAAKEAVSVYKRS